MRADVFMITLIRFGRQKENHIKGKWNFVSKQYEYYYY